MSRPPGPPYYVPAPDHREATTVLVLGILGLVLFLGVVAFPFVLAFG